MLAAPCIAESARRALGSRPGDCAEVARRFGNAMAHHVRTHAARRDPRLPHTWALGTVRWYRVGRDGRVPVVVMDADADGNATVAVGSTALYGRRLADLEPVEAEGRDPRLPAESEEVAA